MSQYRKTAILIHTDMLARAAVRHIALEISLDEVEARLETFMHTDPVEFPKAEKRAPRNGRDWEQREKKRRR